MEELLIHELCTRFPHGVICRGEYKEHDFDTDSYYTEVVIGPMTKIEYTPKHCSITIDLTCRCDISTVKPYLRPMSSMTEEEREELKQLSDEYLEEWTNAQTPIDKWNLDGKISYKRSVFYNSHHLDWNGLIEKGLALEATEDMYGTKTNDNE